MQFLENIKQGCFYTASFGFLGRLWFGGVLASTLAIPAVFLLRSLYWINRGLFFWVLFIGMALVAGIIQLALLSAKEVKRSAIVLDKIVGVMIALICVPLQWRFILFGFALFHVLNNAYLFFYYKKVIGYIERLPGVVGILLPEVLSGFLINFFLQVIMWVVGL